MDVFTASLRSACSLRRGHFVNNLQPPVGGCAVKY
ncbi:gluconate 5-dehydrogenase [Yersinia similis]